MLDGWGGVGFIYMFLCVLDFLESFFQFLVSCSFLGVKKMRL